MYAMCLHWGGAGGVNGGGIFMAVYLWQSRLGRVVSGKSM